jgi:methyl-accepting chemotaxis protein
MSTLLQAADSTSLKNKSIFFFVLTVLLTLTAAGAVLCGWPPVAALAALALLLWSLAAALLCFQYSAARPLADLNADIRSMIDGHLDQLSRIRRADEIGSLAESVNDLAINMQEVLLFAWNHSQQSCDLLNQIAERLEILPDKNGELSGIKENLAHMRRDNEDLKAIVTSFSYFEIRLERERMLAEADCCGDGGCGPDSACRQRRN